jgi:hypothetical protein
MAGGQLPDWATWAQRLSIALAGLLDDPAAATAVRPDGGADLAPADLIEVLGALDHAEQLMRERTAQGCEACATTESGACDVCLDQLDQADAYAELAARLGGPDGPSPAATADAFAGLRAEVVNAIDTVLVCAGAARQLGAIRAVLAVLDSEHGDRQLALEEIGRIADGTEDL